ncbi:hypothetical protein MKZ38_002018 [Zalerion maritima]|uniref:Uncharacterized protein n=1 Tax=Zalerion maritima TaxID=339359 RepID=A0AAD5RPH7_9PEZI|nr:hypothetical protein MKZ38_002018 [Zalerion maritima]
MPVKESRRQAVEKWVTETLPGLDSAEAVESMEEETASERPKSRSPSIPEIPSPTKTQVGAQSPLRGHVMLISDSEGSFPHSVSFASSRAMPNVDISLSLTDAQMDKLASAIVDRTDNEDRQSTEKTNDAPLETSHSPVRRPIHRSGTVGGHSWHRDTLETISGRKEVSYNVSPPSSKAASSPRKMIKIHWDDGNKQERHGRKKSLPRIDTGRARMYSDARKHTSVVVKSAENHHHSIHPPLGSPDLGPVDDTSSVYSDEYSPVRISGLKPLYIPSVKRPAPNGSVLLSYAKHSGNTAARASQTALSFRNTGHNHGSPSEDRVALDATYTPLSPYLATTARKEKTMIGEKGWLEDTGEPRKAGPVKKQGILETLRKKAKEMAIFNDSRTSRRPRDEPTGEETRSRRPVVVISLDPREQSLLYCELEFTLTTALNDYVSTQFNEGRLDTVKLKRVSDSWASKGRPKVVAFRYDLETQLDLVACHVEEFRFYGFRQGNQLQIMSVVDAMRNHARAMRVRSFCHPDLVVHKQVLDARALGDIIGADPQARLAIDQIWIFFGRIVDREKRRLEEDPQSAQGSGRRSISHSDHQATLDHDPSTGSTMYPYGN